MQRKVFNEQRVDFQPNKLKNNYEDSAYKPFSWCDLDLGVNIME